MHPHAQIKITKICKIHLTLVKVNVENSVEAPVLHGACVEVEGPQSAFSDSQKKTGQNYFAKGLL